MKIRVLACSLFCLALLPTGFCAEPAANQSPASADSGKKSPPRLKEGMAAAEVMKIVGKPDKVEPLPGTEVKAEKWLYRRLVKSGTTQVAVGQQEQPAFSDLGDGTIKTTMVSTPIYRLRSYEVYQVSALLVVDGKMVTAKQWQEREERFAD